MTDSVAVVDVSRYSPGPGQGEALLDAMRRAASDPVISLVVRVSELRLRKRWTGK
jgi:hypothetical protein